MIQHENGVFLLKNDAFSLMLRVNSWGLLEQLHFGGPVELSDAPGFVLRQGLGWGASVLLEGGNTASCADAMALAFSGSGRGDYRESPLTISGISTDLRYSGFEILEGTVPMSGAMPQARDASQTLRIDMTQPGLTLELYFSLFDTALTRRTVLRNTGDCPVELQKCMSFSMDLPGQLQMTAFGGGWIAEMRKSVTPVTQTRVVSESVTGFSSHRNQPGFLLSEPDATEDQGRVYGCNLIWSGNHYASAQASLQGLVRVMQGISPDNFRRELLSGESFETPEAVLTVSDRGFGGVSRNMHRFVNEHIIPRQWQYQPRPVLYNSWEGCMFDFDRSSLLRLAKQAKELGCELFVLDDGWFGKRNNDLSGLGDYEVNRKKLPGGLKALGERLNAMGLEFGLWLEPESVNPDSDLYRAHPDWALTDDHPQVLGRNQLLLDLTRPEVRDYIVQQVGATLDSAPITYVKWDMNRHSVALGSKAYDYILGLYEILERIFGPRPRVLLESCASGGNRFDLGMLCFGPQIWCSDNTDPIERLTIQGNLSYLYPQSTFGAHVSASPHAQTLRTTPLNTRGNVSFFGLLGYELDLSHLLPVEEKEIMEQIRFYKQHRQLFQFGSFFRLKQGWQVSNGNTSAVGIFRELVHGAPGWEWLRCKELDTAKQYRICSRANALRIGQFGNLVKHIVPVDLKPNGLVLRTADKHFTLPDGQQELTVSGGALLAGISLLPLFRGTGYDKEQRTSLDLGSELFIIEEVKP